MLSPDRSSGKCVAIANKESSATTNTHRISTVGDPGDYNPRILTTRNPAPSPKQRTVALLR